MPRLTDEEKKELKELGIDVDADDFEEEEPEESDETGDTQNSAEDESEGSEGEEGAGDDKPEDQPTGQDSGESDPEPPPSPPEKEDDPELKEELRRLNERLAYYEERERKLEEERKAAPQPEAEEKTQPEPEYVLHNLHLEEFNQRFEKLEQGYKKLDEARNVTLDMAKRQEKNLASSAYDVIRQKYPDFDDFVKPEFRERALNAVLENSDKVPFGSTNWVGELENAYKTLSFDHYRKKASELEAKREEKKAREKKEIRGKGKVLPSGSSFQRPVAKTSKPEVGALGDYRALKGEAMRILEGE